MSEKTAVGYARELVASLWHSFPEDAEQPVADAIAAAEERGRRSAETERDELVALLRLARNFVQLQAARNPISYNLEALNRIDTALADLALRDSAPKHAENCNCKPCMEARAARWTAPRASAPQSLVVCDHCPEFPHPLNDDGTVCSNPKAPRDSGNADLRDAGEGASRAVLESEDSE